MRIRRSGFTLPAVLAVTGTVTLIFLVAITASANLTREANAAQARVRFMEAALTLEAGVAFMVATEPLGLDAVAVGQPRSLDEFSVGQSQGATTPVHLDNRPYSTEPFAPMILSLQDEAGMINLAGLDETQTLRLSDALGIGGSLSRRTHQIYLDYIDADSGRRVEGAEQPDYGRSRVANRYFLRPSEFLSLLGVRQGVDNRRWRGLENDLAFDRNTFLVNVNTASSQTLQVLYGVTPAQAEAAIRARQSAPFMSLEDFLGATGTANVVGDERRYTFPSGRFVYTIRDTRSRWTYRARIALTPAGAERPLWIDQTELKEAASDADSNPTDATLFPYPLG